MPYFDPDESCDLALLHSTVRSHSELSNVAARVEKEIIRKYKKWLRRERLWSIDVATDDYYTVLEGNHWYGVYLTGYDPDPANADGYNADRTLWSGLCDALRDAIANVVSETLRQYSRNTGFTSESLGDYSYTKSTTTEEAINVKWPQGWDAPLRIYDRRPPVFHA